MNKLKIVLLTIFGILCILIISGILFYYHIDTTYTVEPDKSQFEDAILNRINKPSSVTNNIEIKQELTLNNKKYFIISFYKDDTYTMLADLYDIRFIFESNIPIVNFYTVPRIDIFATDSNNGY